MRRHDYEVDEAGDGRTGLALLHEHPETCVVVLDLLMENGDGWWFRDHQLSDPAIAAVPVIVLSIGTRHRVPSIRAEGAPDAAQNPKPRRSVDRDPNGTQSKRTRFVAGPPWVAR